MIDLSQISTQAPEGLDKEAGKAETEGLVERLRDLQNRLYASQQRSVLVILQGLDASGKDGVINKVFSGVNLLGIRVVAFKAPTEEEQAHDFLWRIHQHTPAKGQITIFNRSHYEDVLVPAVQGWVDKPEIKRRYRHINAFEQLLKDSGTEVLKFYLHVSEEKQRERLEERLANPEKHWKHRDGDWQDLERRKKFIQAYHNLFAATTEAFPWHVVPADQNWHKAYFVAKTVVEALDAMKLQFPKLEGGA